MSVRTSPLNVFCTASTNPICARRPLIFSAVSVKPASRYSVSPYFSTNKSSEPWPVI